MSFKDLTPEQRAAMREKSAATRRANAAKRAVAIPPSDEGERPVSLADLGFAAAIDDDVLPTDGLLTAEEIEAAKAAGRKKYLDEQKKKARQAMTDLAYDEARREAGVMPPDEEDRKAREELVQVRVQMPTLRKPTGGELPPEPILLDQRLFVSGRTYTVERHVAVYLVGLMDLARRHVNQVDGRSKTYYAEGVGQMIYQGGAAAGGPAGPSFGAIHRRPAA